MFFKIGTPWNFPLSQFQVDGSRSLTPLIHVLQNRDALEIPFPQNST